MREKYFRFTIQSGSAKVYNCHKVTRALDNAAREDGTSPKHLFSCIGLNKAVIIKVVDPAQARDKPLPGRVQTRAIKTKVHLSFDDEDITKGGAAVQFDHPDREQALADLAGLNRGLGEDVFKRDMGILEAMAKLPSLDPFLLKDRLMAYSAEVDPSYFAISPAEWDRISRRIRVKIRPMVLMAAQGQADVEGKVQLLLDKLWDSHGLEEFAPFFRAMNLPVDKTAEIMQAWKGITFYEIEYGELTPKVQQFGLWIKDGSQPIDTIHRTDRATVDKLRESIRSKVKRNLADIATILSDYQDSYDELFVHRKGAQKFGGFLGRSSQNFNNLGACLNEVSHAFLVWNEMSSRYKNRQMKGANLIEMFEVLDDIFGARDA
ncbi:MAG: hypothetical protein FJX60_23070 [Alphaproteobacteria bacterium]|nr:hypothetical protein [Alphaproteobacteria bacterium]